MEEKKLISHMSTDEKLTKIAGDCERIKGCLLGDEYNEVGLLEKFDNHERRDESRFDAIEKRLTGLDNEGWFQKGFKKGAGWIVAGLVIIIEIVVNVVK